ncbi:methylamine dehydrogenase light chain [uncultured Dechloromonas sp.]|uniref:methylamine dehydrogenase light chain n=1 Tax=uncultured Dechloromonas sp. TaxID=171719 RepID=UPI0025E79775|nr:methylamine dehydrogenase light chain [uncultured Dechloromonas sp.]
MDFLKLLDRFTERRTRSVAQNATRRGFLVGVSKLLVAGAFALPVLPFDRTNSAHAAGGHGAPKKKGEPTDTDCDYWRYCSVDGFLCSCCGGTMTTCPPGSTPSAVSWVGTCHNPADGRDYLVSYNDCCGKTSCGRCFCNTNIRERPGYRMGVHNDINWCMANQSSHYHCTVSIIVGLEEGQS